MRDPIIPTRSRERIAADNREELEGWIEERVAQLASHGMAPADARRQALEEFGDADAAERYAERQDIAADRRVRLALWFEEVRSDLRIALRTLARTPTVTAVVLLTFALGIGATTAVFSVVHALLLRPLPYANEGTLIYLQALDNGVVGPNARSSAATLVGLRERTTSFTALASASTGNFVVSGNGDPEQVTGAILSGNAFDVFKSPPNLGRSFTVSEESGAASNVIILGDQLWRQRYGADPGIVGRTVAIDNERRLVLGVMPPHVRVPTYEDAQFWIPQGVASFNAHPTARHVRVLRLFGRLKPGVSLPAAQADVDRVMRMLEVEHPQANRGLDARLVPIRTAVAGSVRPRLFVLMGAAAFVLALACANVAGILLSRAIARRHELSIRIALGAGRRRLVRQFISEGAALALLGTGLGLLVAWLGIAMLRHIASTSLPAGTTFGLEPRVLMFGIGVAVAGALAASLVPAFVATRVPGIALRRDQGRASLSRANRRLRLGLVAGQLVVSVVLLIGAGLFLRALQRLAAVDVGYSTEHALTFRPRFTRPMSNADQDAFYDALYSQLRAIPGVVSVGGGNVPTSGLGTVSGLAIEGRPVENGRLPDARYTPASDDYFATLGIPIVRGRAFNAGDRVGAPAVAVVSVGLANQLWPGGDPIGARVKPGPDREWATVVGIVGDVRMGGGTDAPQPSVYTSQRQDHWPGASSIIVRGSGDAAALMSSVRQVVRRVDPTLVIVGMRTLEEFRQSTPAIADRRVQMHMILAFALCALAVSAIGVYGVSAYATEARSREFGIRMALGASRRGVLWLALEDGASVAALGALAGVPIAVLIASRLGDMLFATTPFDPLIVSVVLGTLTAVVLAASLVPARRATLIDPARTMRSD